MSPPEEQPQTESPPPPKEPKLTEEAQAAHEAAAQAEVERHARVVAERQAQERAAAARTRYAQIVDTIRSGGTPEELEQACDLLKPIALDVSSRL